MQNVMLEHLFYVKRKTQRSTSNVRRNEKKQCTFGKKVVIMIHRGGEMPITYTDEFKGECLVQLAVNKFDYEKTAEQMGVSTKSLRRWAINIPKRSVPEMLERAIMQMLSRIPESFRGDDWGVTVGILFDKWLLVQGRATSRNETVTKDITGTIDELNEDEVNGVIDAAREIIAESKGSRASADSHGKQSP